VNQITGLAKKLETLAKAQGAGLFGVADLTPAAELITQQGGEALGGFPRGISIGMPLSGQMVDIIAHQDNPHYMKSYHHHVYQVINPRLDFAALNLAAALEAEGFRALPAAASLTTDGKLLKGLFTHKLAANLAGLGWIGKSCLLITPEYGPRVRFATILTNALLPAGTPLENRCGDCKACIKICPPGALTGRPFNTDEPREKRFDAHKCDRHRTEKEKATGSLTCGLCVYICPHGKQMK